MKNIKTYVILMVTVALLAGCKKPETVVQNQSLDATAQMVKNQMMMGGHQMPGAETPKGDNFKGKVTQTMNSGGYTYVAINKDGKEVWGALEETKVAVGDEVEYGIDTIMSNFSSKTLKKTFDQIYFLRPIVNSDKTAATMPPNHPSITGNTALDHSQMTSAGDMKVAAGSIKTADSGLTVADVFTKKTQLVGKAVAIRGKVVKFTPNIMGTNWVHIKDGSAVNGTDDLTITTKDTAAVGDVILATGGALAVDKDFGAGYKYTAILENASLKVE